MKTVSVQVPIRGNITQFELQRAICNRLEEVENNKINYPPLRNKNIPKMEVNRVTSHAFFSKMIGEVGKFMP